MGQSLSRRRPAPVSAPASEHMNVTHAPRRSLPSRILSSLPKPSLRSRQPPSLALPTQPEVTGRGKKRRWGFSRRRNISTNTEGTVPEQIYPLVEQDEHQVDRDVDEFGVITHRVPDSHSDSQATSAKGKERARDVPGVEDENEDNDAPVSSSSSAYPLSQSRARTDQADNGPIPAFPTVPPPLLPAVQQLEHPLDLPSSIPTLSLPSSPSTQPMNSGLRPFPPPGTLVVVQGVVHTTDVPRSSERPVATSTPPPSTSHDGIGSNANNALEASSMRPSSLPPGARSHNPSSGNFQRPASMTSAVPSSLPPDSAIDSSMTDPQTRPVTTNASGIVQDSENEERTHGHPPGFSMTQGPIGASGLSASSIDVLGTLLSVAAAATAASLLTGSSEPIFSSGLTSSQAPLASDTIPQPTGFGPNIPSERPLSPTPTSDAGRMRHVWSSLRDRLGLGSGAQNSSHLSSNPSSGSANSEPSQPPDFVRPRDPREIMLAEMARAFNLGLGLGGATASTQSPNTHVPEGGVPDNSDILGEDRSREQSSLPPPDSFERFLVDLQTDLRVTLMQEQDSTAVEGAPQNTHDAAEDVEDEDPPLPELQSLSDSGSEGSGTRDFESGDEDEPVGEDGVEENVHATQEQLSGRTSPAVSAFGTGVHSPFGIRTRFGSTPTLQAGGSSPLHSAPSQPLSAAVLSNTMGNYEGNAHAVHASSSVAVRIGTHVPVVDLNPSEAGSEGHEERATSGVAHSPASDGELRAEGGRAISGVTAVPPDNSQDPSNVLRSVTTPEFLLPGAQSLSVPLMSDTPNSLQLGSATATQEPVHPSTWASPLPSDPEPTTRHSSPTNVDPVNSPMPFRLPFTPSSASRTEHTPGGGINWWRMYRFPAVASPNLGQLGGPQGAFPPSQTPLRTPAEGPSHPSTSWTRTTDQNQQNEVITPRRATEAPDVHNGLAVPALTPPASRTNMPGLVPAPSQSNRTPLHTNGQDPNSSTGTNINGPPEHRSNVVVPVIVVGLQSVNMDRQPPQVPHPHANHPTTIDDEDGEGVEFDGLGQSMSTPLQIPEPVEFRRHSSNTTQPEQNGHQPPRGRTWQSRAANAFRNLRSSRRNADTTSPQPQETPGSRTFLIYVIGGYYPPDHQIITGGNLDSFEALWELAELLGQVKPPTVSKEEIERSGLEVIKSSMLEEYEKQGRIASNCVDKCLICLDEYNSEDELRVLTCKHAFHQGCVDRWLETGRNNCPACRTKGVVNLDA